MYALDRDKIERSLSKNKIRSHRIKYIIEMISIEIYIFLSKLSKLPSINIINNAVKRLNDEFYSFIIKIYYSFSNWKRFLFGFMILSIYFISIWYSIDAFIESEKGKSGISILLILVSISSLLGFLNGNEVLIKNTFQYPLKIIRKSRKLKITTTISAFILFLIMIYYGMTYIVNSKQPVSFQIVGAWTGYYNIDAKNQIKIVLSSVDETHVRVEYNYNSTDKPLEWFSREINKNGVSWNASNGDLYSMSFNNDRLEATLTVISRGKIFIAILGKCDCM